MVYFQEQKKDVELSKDNLKTFIERWEEHPNSPYVFDVESNVIMPLKDSSRNSISSSRGELLGFYLCVYEHLTLCLPVLFRLNLKKTYSFPSTQSKAFTLLDPTLLNDFVFN